MNTNLTYIIIIAIFAVLAVSAFLLFRQRAKVDVKGPFGTGVRIDASNPTPSTRPAIETGSIKSRKGGLTAEDQTAGGIKTGDVEVEKDVQLRSTKGGEESPKASPRHSIGGCMDSNRRPQCWT